MRAKVFGHPDDNSDDPNKGKMARKRSHFERDSNSNESDDVENIPPKKRSNNRIHDPYCWVCHQDQTNINCTTCIRTYHSHCIVNDDDLDDNAYKCDVCIKTTMAKKDYKKRNVNNEHFLKMLGYITDRLSKDQQFNRLGSSMFSNLRKPVLAGPDIINPFDLSIVMEKMEDKSYITTLEFINDIRWIRHNAEIVLSGNDSRLEAARNMEELCEKEIYDIEMCSECFERANNTEKWFTAACNPPHLIVWSRIKGHPYWPAKVIGLNATYHDKIDVRFFGKHEMKIVSAADCYLFSDNPNKKSWEQIDACIKEADEYVKSLGEKYSCDVVLSEPKTPLQLNRIREQLLEMISGLNLPADYTLINKPAYLKKSRRRKGNCTSPWQHQKPPFFFGGIKIKDCSVLLERCEALIKFYTQISEPSEEICRENQCQEIEGNENDRHEEQRSENDRLEEDKLRQYLEFSKKNEMVIKVSNIFFIRDNLTAMIPNYYMKSPNDAALDQMNTTDECLIISSDSENESHQDDLTVKSSTTEKDTDETDQDDSDKLTVIRTKPAKRTYSNYRQKRASVKQSPDGSKSPVESLLKPIFKAPPKSRVYVRKSYNVPRMNLAIRRDTRSVKKSNATMEINSNDCDSGLKDDASVNEKVMSETEEVINLDDSINDLNLHYSGGDSLIIPVEDESMEIEAQNEAMEIVAASEFNQNELNSVNIDQLEGTVNANGSDLLNSNQSKEDGKESIDVQNDSKTPNGPNNEPPKDSTEQILPVVNENVEENASHAGPIELNQTEKSTNEASKEQTVNLTLENIGVANKNASSLPCNSEADIAINQEASVIPENPTETGEKIENGKELQNIIHDLTILKGSREIYDPIVQFLRITDENQKDKQNIEIELKKTKTILLETERKSSVLIKQLKKQIADLRKEFNKKLQEKDGEIKNLNHLLKVVCDDQEKRDEDTVDSPPYEPVEPVSLRDKLCNICETPINNDIAHFQQPVCNEICLKKMWEKQPENEPKGHGNEDDPQQETVSVSSGSIVPDTPEKSDDDLTDLIKLLVDEETIAEIESYC